MTDTTYNGWTNYETWCVKLWLDNEQGSQEWMIEQARECLESAIDNDVSDILTSAKGDLAERLEGFHDEAQETGDMKVTGVFADLLRHALGRVEWREIAENVLGDIEVYSAGWNMPGYMPDNAPAFFLDLDEARSYIADEMESYAEQQDEASSAEAALTEAAEKVRKGTGEYGETVGDYHYFITRAFA